MKRIPATDGHRLRSRSVLVVDNLLSAHDLLHEVEPEVPGADFRADFAVGPVFVEVWAEGDRDRYDRPRRLGRYERLRLPMVEIGDRERRSARALRGKFEEIQSLLRQHPRVAPTEARRPGGRDRPLDLWLVAEILAHSSGRLRRIDSEIVSLRERADRLTNELRDLEFDRRGLQERRSRIVRDFLAGAEERNSRAGAETGPGPRAFGRRGREEGVRREPPA
jgi:hypothetical protein